MNLAHTAPGPAGDWRSLGFSLGMSPGIHALHDDLLLLALHHVVGEHGVEVRDGGCQHDPVRAEFMVPDLRRGKREGEGISTIHGSVIPCSTAPPAYKDSSFCSDCSSQSFFSLIFMSVWLIPVRAHPSLCRTALFSSLKQKFPIGALFYGQSSWHSRALPSRLSKESSSPLQNPPPAFHLQKCCLDSGFPRFPTVPPLSLQAWSAQSQQTQTC